LAGRSRAWRGRILLRAEGRTVFYTRREFRSPVAQPRCGVSGVSVDVLIIETTRGDSPCRKGSAARRKSAASRRRSGGLRTRRLCARAGFRARKTQEVLTMLYEFKREKLLDDVADLHRWVSSKMTEIYDRRANSSPRSCPGCSSS